MGVAARNSPKKTNALRTLIPSVPWGRRKVVIGSHFSAGPSAAIDSFSSLVALQTRAGLCVFEARKGP